MTPLKIFLNLRMRLKSAETSMKKPPGDPFDDPDIRSMDLRQLADLPFPGIYGETCLKKMPLSKCA